MRIARVFHRIIHQDIVVFASIGIQDEVDINACRVLHDCNGFRAYRPCDKNKAQLLIEFSLPFKFGDSDAKVVDSGYFFYSICLYPFYIVIKD